MISTILKVLKIVVIIALAGGSILFLGDLLGLINTSLLVSALGEITNFNIPILLLTAYPNVWLLFGYFFFKGILGLGIKVLKREI